MDGNTKQLYIIRGTGLPLDGSVVEIIPEYEGGDYVAVAAPNSPKTLSTLIKRVCLQKLESKNVTYTITIERTGSIVDESSTFKLTNCPREVSTDTIVEFLNANLSPILRME